jgi:hypothetical protein
MLNILKKQNGMTIIGQEGSESYAHQENSFPRIAG